MLVTKSLLEDYFFGTDYVSTLDLEWVKQLSENENSVECLVKFEGDEPQKMEINFDESGWITQIMYLEA